MLPDESHMRLEEQFRYATTEAIDVVNQVGAGAGVTQLGDNVGANANLGGTQNVKNMIFYNSRFGGKEDQFVQNDIAWISTSNPEAIHGKAITNRVERTGSWLLENSKQFESWKSTPGHFLWLHGKAGCGKTFLCAGIIEHLEQQKKNNATSTIPTVPNSLAYYYFSFREPISAEQDLDTTPIENLLRSLIKQLCVNHPKLPRAVQYLNSNVELRKSNKIDVRTLKTTLLDLAKELGRAYIIIDALDELGTPVLKEDSYYLSKLTRARSNMIELLKSLAECNAIHLLVTSKDDASWDIIDKSLGALASKEGNHNISVEGEGLDGDIDKMIDDELSKPHWQAYDDPDLLALIKDRTRSANAVNGMFRLARCRLEELYKVIDPNQKPDPKVVENALINLPDEIYELYDNAVEYISSIGNAKMALQWLMCAVRPLKISELAELMDWRQGTKSDHRSIRRTFGSLITVSSGAEDYNNAPVELAHFTVREYLSAERVQHNVFRGGEYEAHLAVAHHCIEYLAYYSSESPDGAHGTEANQVTLSKRPLLEYAINNWYRHALVSFEKMPLVDSSRKALIDGGGKGGPALTKSLRDMAGMNTRLGELTSSFLKRLYRAYSEWETSLMAMLAVSPPTERKAVTTANPGLRSLSRTNTFISTKGVGNLSSIRTFSGWVESTKYLLESLHPDLNEYRTSVQKAAYRGYEFMIDLLLELGASANARNPHYNVLTAASTDRYHLVTMLLLEKEVGESYGDTWWPEESALEVNTDGTSIVRSLLLAGADVAISNFMGETTLHQVAANGKVAIARLLLSRQAKTEQQCSGNGIVVSIYKKKVSWGWKCSGTPLHWAVSKGHHNIVRLLLNHSADMSATLDGTDQTALHLAARDSDVEMTQLLLDRGADIEAKDGAGISALQFASYSGNLGIVKCLLENGADVRVCASNGTTPLQIASFQGHKDVVTELLSRGVNVDIAEDHGLTALHFAAHGGRDEIVQMLLNSGAQTEATSIYGNTALAIAAREGAVDCMTKLLDHGAKIDEQNKSGETALSLVAERGHVDGAKLLLDRKSDVNLRSMAWGPILNAATYGGTDVVFQACVDRGADLQEKDIYGRTLIHFAAAGGNVDMISTVLGRGHSAHTKDKQGRNALHFAATSTSVAAVTKILEQGVDYRLGDNDGWTPLHWAVKTGDVSVVKFLLEAGPVEGSVEWTPARIAALHGHTILLPILQAKTSSEEGALVENSKPTEPEGYDHDSAECDGCFLEVVGTRYRCFECQVIDFCFKCMWSRATIHTLGHRFETIKGGEFVHYDSRQTAANWNSS